tara:strand:- start:93 stop:1949 length:1857 start_codon:yes stop_codon:yes gene_type:complete
MACGFCKATGHTIRTCTHPGAEGVRRENAAKAEEKRRAKDAREWERYSIQPDMIQLESPPMYPGNVNVLFSDDCQTVQGAIATAMPEGYLPYIVSCMNLRISKRNVCAEVRASSGRATKTRTFAISAPNTPQKGRPAITGKRRGKKQVTKAVLRSARRKRRRSLEPCLTEGVSVRELKKFFSILLYASTQRVVEYALFWKTTKDAGVHTFPRRLMSRERFSLLYSCFLFEEEEMRHLEDMLSDHLLKVWNPSNGVCVDETLVPFKGRGNPHHVFIMRKPHPHGTKLWTSVDYSGYFLRLSIFRRGEAKESPTATVMKMIRGIAPESLVITDSYFGGMRTLEALSLEGHLGLMSCKQTQPSFLFRDHLMPKCKGDGDCHTSYGVLQNGQPFLANVFMSRKRKLLTLSSAYSVEISSVPIQALVPDETAEDQMEILLGEEDRPQVRNFYSQYMDFNDVGNGAVIRLYPPFRKRHWTTSVMFWIVMMLIGNNAYKLYQSATGSLDMTRKEWVDGVRRVLSGEVEHSFDPSGRKIFTRHPESKKMKGAKDLYCKSCTDGERRTRWRCPLCGPICKVCQMDTERHLSFVHLLSRKRKRSYYSQGREFARKRNINEASVSRLVY